MSHQVAGSLHEHTEAEAAFREALETKFREASNQACIPSLPAETICTYYLEGCIVGIWCGTEEIKVLDGSDSERYLGRKLSLQQYHEIEFNNRLASGWAAFFKFKGALCDRGLPLKQRIRLFEATVTPCVLYACSASTTSAEIQRQLRSTKMRMLRRMVRAARLQDEDWPSYVRRATYTSEELAKKHGATD